MNDKITFAVIIMLGAVGILVVVGGLVLAYNDKALPGELIAIGAGAVSAIAAILANPGRQVEVVNEPDNPVPVDGGFATKPSILLLVAALLLAVVAVILFLGWFGTDAELGDAFALVSASLVAFYAAHLVE